MIAAAYLAVIVGYVSVDFLLHCDVFPVWELGRILPLSGCNLQADRDDCNDSLGDTVEDACTALESDDDGARLAGCIGLGFSVVVTEGAALFGSRLDPRLLSIFGSGILLFNMSNQYQEFFNNQSK